MIDDIVARLRSSLSQRKWWPRDRLEAADEIERLRENVANCIAVEEHLTAEIKRKDAALQYFLSDDDVRDFGEWFETGLKQSRAALAGEKTND